MSNVNQAPPCAPPSTNGEALGQLGELVAWYVSDGYLHGFRLGLFYAKEIYERELRKQAKKSGRRVERLLLGTDERLVRILNAATEKQLFDLTVQFLCSSVISELGQPAWERLFNEIVTRQLNLRGSIENKQALIDSLKAKGLCVCEFCGKLGGTEYRGSCSPKCAEANRQRKYYVARKRRSNH
jgi:hypothetical protein